MIKKTLKKNCIRYHSPDFRFSLTSTSDLVLLTLNDRLLMDLIRASGIRENLGEVHPLLGHKKFFTANIFIVPESIKITWRFSRSKKTILTYFRFEIQFYSIPIVTCHTFQIFRLSLVLKTNSPDRLLFQFTRPLPCFL